MVSGLRRHFQMLVATLASLVLLAGTAVLAEPVPSATVSSTSGFLGTDVVVSVSFENNADTEDTDEDDVGFGPYVDLIIPPIGHEPLEFKGATYLEQDLETVTLTLGDDGNAEHPFARGADGEPMTVSGPAGSTLVVVVLPFGSFTPDQPEIEIDVLLGISDEAEPEGPLPVNVAGGFRYGADALDNSATDPSIVQETADAGTVTPELIRLTKNLRAPQGDTAVGSNFEFEFDLVLELAPGQTISALDITDCFPSSLV